jgi:hypothetical protein
MSQGTIQRRFTKVAVTPVEALRLCEDIAAIKQAIALLQTVDRYNVQEDPDSDELWMCVQKLGMMRRFAANKMRQKYLVTNLNERRT